MYSMIRTLSVVVILQTSLLHVVSEAPDDCMSQNGDSCMHVSDGDTFTCELYLAPSIGNPDELTVYTAVSRRPMQFVGESQLALPIVDANKNEYSPWHDFKYNSEILPSPSIIEFQHFHDVIVAGIGTYVACAEDSDANVAIVLDDETNCLDVSCNFTVRLKSTRRLEVGEQLSLDCSLAVEFEAYGNKSIERRTVPRQWLVENGICYDELVVAKSTVDGAGRGAFSKRHITKGSVIAVSPVLHFDTSQIEIVEQGPARSNYTFVRSHGIEYSSNVIGQQLMMNYCFGHDSSNILLLPHAPGVNFVNHHVTPNAYIRWSTSLGDSQHIRDKVTVMELLDTTTKSLAIDFVALRDISLGEEILIDYGSNWSKAWEEKMLSRLEQREKLGFRHIMQVPDQFYPTNWMRYDRKKGTPDFIENSLKPGYVAPVRWHDTRNVVSPWLFRMGLNKRLREVLYDYCNRVGVTDALAYVTREGNGLDMDSDGYVKLDGNSWYIQRPDMRWGSNLHWLSPGERSAHESYLQALSMAGLDDVLRSLGDYLGLDGLAVFQVTFIAVSHSTKGLLHHDMKNTGGKAYNIIIPLLLANDTDPELDLAGQDGQVVGKYHYEYDVAVLLGDDAKHGTAAVDYRRKKEMRLAATVYVADINSDNVDSIVKHITQIYPPRDKDFIMRSAGSHWKRFDETKKLPQPTEDHILVRQSMKCDID